MLLWCLHEFVLASQQASLWKSEQPCFVWTASLSFPLAPGIDGNGPVLAPNILGPFPLNDSPCDQSCALETYPEHWNALVISCHCCFWLFLNLQILRFEMVSIPVHLCLQAPGMTPSITVKVPVLCGLALRSQGEPSWQLKNFGFCRGGPGQPGLVSNDMSAIVP